jgi:uncharacterized protein (TIGR02145 family)
MSENLNVEKFRNGDKIPEAKNHSEWNAACEKHQPAWCYYNFNPAIEKKYGKLYNWYAIKDSRGLAPNGWKIPNSFDFNALHLFVGSDSLAASKMISQFTFNWPSNMNGNNQTGFTALPSGMRTLNNTFYGNSCWLWTNTIENDLIYIDVILVDGSWALMAITDGGNSSVKRGLSVRCIKE